MDTCRKRTAWTAIGLLLTLITASPVWADDVELFLSTPGAGSAAKPNILFIIDSSGSMTTVENTQSLYDSSIAYAGSCDLDKYYWDTGSGVPNCDPDKFFFAKSVFHCQQGVDQISAVGSYTDTMAMYVDDGEWIWDELYKNLANNAVECQADSGVHGYGAAAATEPYARSGENQPMYTSDPDLAVSWGSSPTAQSYTVYDGNYLNWYNSPPGGSLSRSDIVKAVTKNVLGSINNVNVGFMRFHNSQGGPVIHAIKDLDANRTQANTVVDNIPASGWTPLSETMYEAALYWRGMAVDYGGATSTDPDALASAAPMVYQQPGEYACAKNFTVLLTDGAPTQDVDVYDKAPLLPNYATALGRSNCTGGNVDGACLDDIAEYLSKEDINPTLPGMQTVATYTIGFSVDLPILQTTAENSGGQYYLASDVQSLSAALTDIITNIFDRDISFTAPAIAVNAFNRTQHLNDLYVSVFRASDELHWPGNLKKYTIAEGEIRDANNNNAVDPATGFFAESSKNFWSQDAGPDGADVLKGGVANILPAPEFRKVYTNNLIGDLTSAGNAVSTANSLAYQPGDFGLTGSAGEPTLADLIEWVRGIDVRDIDNNPATTTRDSMGDTLHSQPAAVVYGGAVAGQDTIVVFNATNDGNLHAVDAATGKELWTFIPRELLPKLRDLYFNLNVNFKNYGLDGDVVPIVADLNKDGVIESGTDFVYLAFGMRRGGDNYYLIDVTDYNKPILKWVRTYPEFGESWSAPVAAKVVINSLNVTSPHNAVLIVGAGYNTAHDSPGHPTSPDIGGAGIFMLDLETGDTVWRAGRDSFADLQLASMTRAIPSRIRVIDLNGDNLADRMYAADLGGQILRFDITNGETANNLVTGGVIAQLGAEGLAAPTAADTRRFYTTPDVAMFMDKRQNRRYLSINIGSGYRAHPLNNAAADRLYSLRDPHVFNRLTQAEYNSYGVIKDGDLVEVAGQMNTVIPAGGDGWKLTLPPEQKVLSEARTFDDSVYFVTFEPTTDSANPCQAGLSINRLYRMNVANGDPVSNLVPSSNSADIDAARITQLTQEGIAPVPVFLFPSPTDPNCTGQACKPNPIACVGAECFDPGFNNMPVRTLWTQDGVE